MRQDDDAGVPSNADAGEDTEELTVGDDEWPVPPQYRDVALPDPATAADAPPEAPPEPSAGAPPAEAPPAGGPPPPVGPESPVEEERRVSAALIAGLVVVLLLLVAGGALLAYTLRDDSEGEAAPETTLPTTGPTGTGPTETGPTETDTTQPTDTTPTARRVVVPGVVGLPLSEARERLEARRLESRVSEVESDAPAGEVVRQQPAAEQEVRRGTTVLLVVSGGPAQVTVPDVVGSSRGRAEAALRDAGLAVAVRTRSSREAAGTVLEQSPGAGARVDPGSTVRLTVASEPEPVLVRVPRVTGLPVGDARARLREAGLRSTVTRVESSRPEGTVVSQSPRSGASVREGEGVQLEVSSGPSLVSVPDVVGMDEAAARETLEGAGFDVTVTEQETSDPSQDGTVLSQTPRAGASVERGTTVTITVARVV